MTWRQCNSASDEAAASGKSQPRNPWNPEMKDSRDPLKMGINASLSPPRSANSVSINKKRGSTGSTGSTAPKVPEIRHSSSAKAGTPCVAPRGSRGSRHVDFAAVNAAALRDLAALLSRWLPDGRVNGREYEARNPRRGDRHRGSFRVNLRTGRWSDFATGDGGGDPVSLSAYLFDLSQIEAARHLAAMLGVP